MDAGHLLASDEGLNHQTVDTFATVGQADLSWTEKLWASVFARDGSLQIDVGLGKYANRNVMDGFAGVSRGREQWTVRASRELASDPEATIAGPIHYEVVKPLEAVRFRLEKNAIQPISFDFVLTGLMPPIFEERDRRWDSKGMRIVTDLLRYHQPGQVDGWLELDGKRHDFDGAWVGYRDHSWGLRRNVGAEPSDLRQPSKSLAEIDYRMHWAPFYMQAPGKAPYELHYYLQGTPHREIYRSGHLNLADGSNVRAWRITPNLRFHRDTRRFLGGNVVFDLENGERRVIELEPMSDTGFHLGSGLYLEFNGHHHGAWRGPLVVEGEYFSDCSAPEALARLHQLRDCIVRAREGDAVGWGLLETVMTGAWPESGLAAHNSLL